MFSRGSSHGRVDIGAVTVVVASLFVVAACSGDGAGDAELRLYGNVDIREVDLAFRVPGRLASLYHDEGDPVAEGEVVAELDAAPMRAALEVAEARVAQARAVLDALRAGSRPEEIDRARAGLADAGATLANAEAELERKQTMFADEAASRRELDQAIAGRARARAAVDAAEAAFALAEEGPRAEDVRAAESAWRAAVAERDRVALELEDATLVAPSEGVVLVRVREPGAMLALGQPVYVLQLTDRVDVRAYVSGAELGRVAPGTAVEVRADTGDRRYRGTVGFVSPRAEFTPKNVQTPELRTDLVYRLRIVIDEPDRSLLQGMPVTVIVPDAGS